MVWLAVVIDLLVVRVDPDVAVEAAVAGLDLAELQATARWFRGRLFDRKGRFAAVEVEVAFRVHAVGIGGA